ncbi:MAG: peptidyl-tRNA hydrolase Pth2 [Thermoplasmata archaeon]|jgi:PTH2 family peptidyl-tRNA hydrolase|nr:peptidyl-tRNA hydrolase Pth2 [Thermoplasmata archaeon]
MPSRRAGLAAGTDYKMVLVVRGELRLTAGKAAAQVAHAAVMLVLSAEKRHAESLAVWLQAGQKKIVLSAPSLADLESIASNARARGIPVAWVEDAGLTEVAPGTRTCIGLGPSPAAQLDPVTGSLGLL